MFTLLENARSNTVGKILAGTEFKLLLLEHGWEGLPVSFIRTVAKSADAPLKSLMQIIGRLSLKEQDDVMRNGRNTFAQMAILWPELFDALQIWQCENQQQAFDKLSALQNVPQHWTPLDSPENKWAFVYFCGSPSVEGRFIEQLSKNTTDNSLLIHTLCRPPSPQVRHTLLVYCQLIRDDLLFLLDDADAGVRSLLPMHLTEDSVILERLSRDEEELVRSAVAEFTPDENLQRRLAEDASPLVALRLLHNKTLSDNVLERLTRHPCALQPTDPRNNFHARRHEENKAELASRLRQLINPTPESCDRLRDDRIFEMNCLLIHHPRVPETFLQTVATSSYKNLKRELVVRDVLPQQVIDTLFQDEDSEIVNALRRQCMSKGIPCELDFAALANSSDKDEVYLAAQHPQCPADLLEHIYLKGDFKVRSFVIWNVGAPLSLLERCLEEYRDTSDINLQFFVLGGLASAPNSSEEILLTLADHPNQSVRWSLSDRTQFFPALLEKLIHDKKADVRAWLAQNPACPESALVALAGDKSVKVRRRLAKNPNVPLSVLEALANDGDARTARICKRHYNVRLKAQK